VDENLGKLHLKSLTRFESAAVRGKRFEHLKTSNTDEPRAVRGK
jgi:hypothetical protein